MKVASREVSGDPDPDNPQNQKTFGRPLPACHCAPGDGSYAIAGRNTLQTIDWNRWLPLLLIAVGLAQAVLQSLFFTEIKFDDAQLIEWAAQARAGNLDQPTLLSNIAWAFSKLGLPPDIFIKIARQVFVVGAILLLQRALRHWTADTALVWIGALSVTLVDDIRGKAVTEFTHYTFLMCTMAAALLIVTLLTERRSIGLYVLLGLSAALVFHSKYNGMLLFFILLAACAYDATARRVFLDRRALVSAAILAALAAPALIWGYLNPSKVTGTFGKYHFDTADRSPFVEALDAYGSSITSVIVVVAIALAYRLWRDRALRFGSPGVDPEKMRLLGRYCLTFFVVSIIAAMALNVGEVGRRWVFPGTMFMAIFGGLLAGQILPKAARPVLLAALAGYWLAVNIWLLLR